jgi:hypothetical protein
MSTLHARVTYIVSTWTVTLEDPSSKFPGDGLSVDGDQILIDLRHYYMYMWIMVSRPDINNKLFTTRERCRFAKVPTCTGKQPFSTSIMQPYDSLLYFNAMRRWYNS